MGSTQELLKTVVCENVYKKDPCIILKDYINSNYGEQSILVEDDQISIMSDYNKYKKDTSAKRQKTRKDYRKDTVIVEERSNLCGTILLSNNVLENTVDDQEKGKEREKIVCRKYGR